MTTFPRLIFTFLLAAHAAGLAADTRAKVHVDFSAAPECEAFALRAKANCEEWYPRINTLLNGTNAPLPYAEVFLTFKPMKGVAATSANRITISAEWVTKKAPNDHGMVIHELTHIVQDYRGKGVGWLTEGIADYVRDYHFEPGARRIRINPDKASYRDGYTTSAAFLKWLENTKDNEIVRKLSIASRENKYRDELFKDFTGKTLDEIWREFTDSLRKKN